MCTLSPVFVSIVSMTAKNIGRFWYRSLAQYFSPGSRLVYDSGASGPKPPRSRPLKPKPAFRVRLLWRSNPMPYALFCNEAKLSKAYPTEADVWKLAQHSGLVVDVVSDEEKPHPRPVLDYDYEIRPCRADPQENPEKNKAEAERDRQLEF